MSKSLRICLIISGDGLKWFAGPEYIKNIAMALGGLPSDIRSTFNLSLLCSKNLNQDILDQVNPYIDTLYYEEEDLLPTTIFNKVRWRLIKKIFHEFDPRLEKFLKKKNIDFVYPYLSKNSAHKFFRSAQCIFDFQHKYLTQFFDENEIRGRDQWFQRVAESSAVVVLNSKSAESDFHKFFPEYTDKTKVVSFKTTPLMLWYEGEATQIQHKYHLPEKFFVISNQFWQHKNHLVVFKALKILAESEVHPNVVCTGYIYDSRNPSYSNEVLRMIHTLDLSKQIYLLGLVPKFDQIQVMRRSIAVIQPSLFEGWSTLVEDARLLGKAIILSNLSVHREQNPPNSIFFEPESPQDLSLKMLKFWQTLSPGPDLEKEQQALENARQEVQSFGYRFLELAKGAL